MRYTQKLSYQKIGRSRVKFVDPKSLIECKKHDYKWMLWLSARIPNSSYSYYSSSQKALHGNISGAEHGIIDPLVSKQPETILNKKRKMVKNCKKF